MKKLSAPAFRRARDFIHTQARPLERARFAHEFEAGPREAVLAELAAFQSPDGGYGRALEPDVRLPASSAIATLTGLDVLHEVAASADEPQVRRAIAWLLGSYDSALPGWRSVPASVDEFPHANHWSWALHAPGGGWPHFMIPGAGLLAHLQHWRPLVPASLLDGYSEAFRAQVESLEGEVGGDSLYYASKVEAPELREKLRALARANVDTDPTRWTEYVNRPLKLAPLPDSLFAETLAAPVAAHLDYEIEHQASDGAWDPNWSWQGAYPSEWETARREWRGELTHKTLRSLRAYGRIEGL